MILTDYGKYIRNYSVVLDSKENPVIALNVVAVNDESAEIYGDSTLVVLAKSDYIDLELAGYVTYEEELVQPAGKLPIAFEVKNNSNQRIDQFTAEVLDEEGQIVCTQVVSCDLSAGDTAEAQIVYELPDQITFRKLTLRVETDGEVDMSNNETEFSVGYADLEIDGLYLSGNRGEAYLEGRVGNNGFEKAENVIVNLYYGDSETAFETVKWDAVDVGETKNLKAAIPSEYMVVNPLAAGNVIRAEVLSDTEELQLENNEKEFLILSEEEMKMGLNASSLNMKAGESADLSIAYYDRDIVKEDVTWTSSKEEVATVADGEVTAVSAGETTITAALGGMSACCVITVSDTEKVNVQSVYLDKSSIYIKMGQSQTLTAGVLPATASNSRFTWKSEDTDVASVTAKGEVTGVGIGETTIAATADDGYHMATCRVVVAQEESQVYTASFTGGEGTSGVRSAAITGEAGLIITLPANPYSKDGMLFAGWSDGQNTYEEGSPYRMPYRNVTFTAMWNDDGKIEHTIIATSGEHGSISPEGKVSVEDGTDQGFAFTPEEGYEVEDVVADGESVGAVTSYVFEDVTEDHTIQVSFREIDDDKVFVERIALDHTEESMGVGESMALTAQITPENATDKAVVWSSSDETVAMVDQSGVVTALKPGEVTITVSAKDGSNVTESCGIIVTKTKQKFAGKTSYKKTYGASSFALDMELAEGDGEISYESSDKAVVTVNISGKVTIRGAGTATVTVTAEETADYAESEVEIKIVIAKAAQRLEGTTSYSKMVGDSDFLLGLTQSEGDGVMSYTSSDDSVVTVNSAGKVSVTGAGTAVITAIAEETDNYKKAKLVIEITVVPDDENPQETEEPQETDAPEETERPQETGVPGETEQPKETGMPGETEQPQETGIPGETSQPEETGQPGSTGKPTVTGQPGSVQIPSNTDAPVALVQPGIAAVVAQGTTLSGPDKKSVYKVTKSGTSINGVVTEAEVEYTKCKQRSSSAVIPNVVTIDGIQYKVSSIANNAFKDDKVLTKIKIGNNILSIGDNAFRGCKKLKSITIPSKVRKIGKQAFYGCKKLKTISIKTAFLTSKNVGKKAFAGIDKTPTVKVPKKQLKAYGKWLKARGIPAKAKISS